MQHNPTIEVCAVGKLFNQKNTIYEIPIYQREYAWEDTEILQLLQDIADYAHEHPKQDYYLGTLVVYPRERDGQMVHETIDGQQRLTTLFILLNVLRVEIPSLNFAGQPLPLTFESRPKAIKALRALADNKIVKDDTIALEIVNAYEIMMRQFLGSQNSYSVSTSAFAKYLLEKVKIAIVPLPEDTDLNRYFETMNSRGEQLEFHEVLKAKLLNVLEEAERPYFRDIWEACADMESYVQKGFKPEQRTAIFGAEWSDLQVHDFNEFCNANPITQPNNDDMSILGILRRKDTKQPTQENANDAISRFTPIINFSNFLLHVLRIQVCEDISLDDKQLLIAFQKAMKDKIEEQKRKFAQEFAYNLLKCRFLLDMYVLKRETVADKDGWSLLKAKKDTQNALSYVNTFGSIGEQKNILMLLSMFHVSTPTPARKNWLYGALYYLHQQTTVSPQDYQAYLEGLAKAFVFDQYLAVVPRKYFTIIYINQGKAQNSQDDLDLDLNELSYGHRGNVLIFNYLDYLLWKKHKGKKGKKTELDKKIADFKFTSRSSVEHYYPQNPIGGERLADGNVLHSFGNLCLISHSKNSKLSNHLPKAKKEYYEKTALDSIKQGLMMQENWGNDLETVAQTINKHYKEMINILLQ